MQQSSEQFIAIVFAAPPLRLASFDSLVNGTHTLAMWIMMTKGPTGRVPRGW